MYAISVSVELVAFGIASTPVLAAIVVHIWLGEIRPRLIPAADIERQADAMTADHGRNAVMMAAIEEDRAWRYSQSFEQAKWHRIGQELQRRRRAVEPPAKPGDSHNAGWRCRIHADD